MKWLLKERGGSTGATVTKLPDAPSHWLVVIPKKFLVSNLVQEGISTLSGYFDTVIKIL